MFFIREILWYETSVTATWFMPQQNCWIFWIPWQSWRSIGPAPPASPTGEGAPCPTSAPAHSSHAELITHSHSAAAWGKTASWYFLVSQHECFAIKEWEESAYIHTYTFIYKVYVFKHTRPSSSCKLGNLSWIILCILFLTLSGNGDDWGIVSNYNILPKMKFESCACWKYSACLSI